MPDLHVRVAIPTADGQLRPETWTSVLALMMEGFPGALDKHAGSYLPRTRDRLTRHVLDDPRATHMLCVDSDILFTADDVRRLLALGTDFAFGYYCNKTAARTLMCDPVRGVVELDTPAGPVRVHEHTRCGGGFVLLTRACLERMTEAYAPTDTYYDAATDREIVGLWQTSGRVEVDGRMIAEGEDYAFCRRWTALGGRIYGHPGVVLGHVGTTVYRPREAER